MGFEPVVAAQALGLLPRELAGVLPEGLVDAASAIPRRHRLDVLTAAARLGFGRDATVEPTVDRTVDPDMAGRLTGEIAGWLRHIAEAGSDGAANNEDLSAVDTGFVRSLRLIWRREGAWRLTRLGERLRSDPVALLAHCSDEFWRAAGTRAAGAGATGLYVLLSVATGMAGDELASHVKAACASDRSARPDRDGDWAMSAGLPVGRRGGSADVQQIEACTSYLARFGAFNDDTEHAVVTADGYALAMAILTP